MQLEIISHYKILKRLGAGGMGEVYLAHDNVLDRKVAIKFLPQHSATDENSRKRLFREARAVAKLDHPNICTVFEVGEEGAQAFIVMQYIEGETLAVRMCKKPLELNEAVDWVIQIADAIAEAHSNGIIHRDLKPQNIIINTHGQAKVLDFGLAKKYLQAGFDYEAETETILTSTGVVIGSLPYLSPEQAQGEQLDERTDIFSLGVMLYEMVSGRHPFRNDTPAATIASILMREPPPLFQFNPATPDHLQQIVSKALQKDRKQRYYTIKDLSVDLKSLRNRLEISAITQLLTLSPVTPSPDVHQPLSKGIDSLAILPLINATSDPSLEYLSDGITESIISNLSQIPTLKVMASSTVFRFKGENADPQEIGTALKVSAVLTGRVLLIGQRLIIKTELVNVSDGSQIWGEQYNRDSSDIFAAQEEISQTVFEKLQLRINSEQRKLLSKRYTENTQAYRFYLKGRYYWNKREKVAVKKALDLFKEAIEIDPAYAMAYAGLSDCYAWLANTISSPRVAMPKAKQAALRAIEIDDSLAEGHTSLGGIKVAYEWDWSGAEAEYKRSLELNPNYATTHQWYGMYLAAIGRLDDSIAELRRAQELDPLSPIISSTLGWFLSFAGQFDEAIDQLQKTIDMEPNFAHAHAYLGHIYNIKGMDREALDEYLSAVRLNGYSSEVVSKLKDGFEASGWDGYWQKEFEVVEAESKNHYVSPFNIAGCYIMVGDKERAFDWLERAYEDRSIMMIWLKIDPVFDSLRSDSRFTNLIQRVGLP